MSDGGALDCRSSSTEAPFEWLTNFRSLRHLVLPSRVAFGHSSSSSSPSKNHDDAKSFERRPTTELQLSLNALHVGCGTSAVGESLLCLRERMSSRGVLRYGNVINVDNDMRALEKMQRRWEGRQTYRENDCTGASASDRNDGGMGNMEWKCLDFNSDESCMSAMEGVYRRLMRHTAATCDEPGGCFDLVLDKSTLDCLLCAETTVVARFLCQVYRALRVPPPPPSNSSRDIGASSEYSWGGVYVLVSFHPAEFVENLLKRLPGADWHVEHEVIQREVEDITLENGVRAVDEVDHHSNNSTEKVTTSPSSSAWSSGTFQPDENYRRTVNVFTCRRCCAQSTKDEASLLPAYILDREQVRMHIERTCDEWYQATNPMVTSEREEQLRVAFSCATASKMNMTDDVRGGDYAELSRADVTLDLKTCYDIIFTEAEKEHLAYEHFLEDWCAYCCRGEGDDSIHQNGMTVAIALDFLKEMQ
jgi:hypothetical protein